MRKIPDSQQFNVATAINNRLWQDDDLGLRKELISFEYVSMQKAADLSKCTIKFSDVIGLAQRSSNYLNGNNQKRQEILIGYPVTVVDFLIEIFLQQMLQGEISRCFICTNSGTEISFLIEMETIQYDRPLFQLSPNEMYLHAQKIKASGVELFKTNNFTIAQYQFGRAAKCLLTFAPFNDLCDEYEEIDGNQLQILLNTIYTNVAACLLKEQRYEDVLLLLKDMTTEVKPLPHNLLPEKAIYRRALAHFHLKQFEEAKIQLERLNYKENKEFHILYHRILSEWHSYKISYAEMVKKMFG